MTVSRRSLLKGAVAAGAATAAVRAEARERKLEPPDAVGLLYDSTRCVGCRACVTKCKEANQLPPDVRRFDGVPYDAPDDLNGTTKNVIKLHMENGRATFVKMQCMHCIDPACVSVCMAKALHKEAGGITAYSKNTCVGCRYCQVACPFNVPKFQWNTATPQIVKCELCRSRAKPDTLGPTRLANPACAEVCPREAVVFGWLEDLKAEAHRRIEENPGRYVEKVYGEKDAGGTQVLYLSAIPFEMLGLPDVGTEPMPEMSETVQHAVYKGFLAPVVLYFALGFTIYRNRKKEVEAEEAEKAHQGEGEDR